MSETKQPQEPDNSPENQKLSNKQLLELYNEEVAKGRIIDVSFEEFKEYYLAELAGWDFD